MPGGHAQALEQIRLMLPQPQLRIHDVRINLVRCALEGTYVEVHGDKQSWTGLAAEEFFAETLGVPLQIIDYRMRVLAEDYEPDPMGHPSDYE